MHSNQDPAPPKLNTFFKKETKIDREAQKRSVMMSEWKGLR